jgi:hypothetical protein
MARNDPPGFFLCAPHACIPERAGKGLALERPAHLHPHANYRDMSEPLDALLARIQTRDTNYSASVRVQIIPLPVYRAVRAGEDERVVKEAIELSNITGELRAPKR